MKCSRGSAAESARSTVRPPTPESNRRSAQRGRAPRAREPRFSRAAQPGRVRAVNLSTVHATNRRVAGDCFHRLAGVHNCAEPAGTSQDYKQGCAVERRLTTDIERPRRLPAAAGNSVAVQGKNLSASGVFVETNDMVCGADRPAARFRDQPRCRRRSIVAPPWSRTLTWRYRPHDGRSLYLRLGLLSDASNSVVSASMISRRTDHIGHQPSITKSAQRRETASGTADRSIAPHDIADHGPAAHRERDSGVITSTDNVNLRTSLGRSAPTPTTWRDSPRHARSGS